MKILIGLGLIVSSLAFAQSAAPPVAPAAGAPMTGAPTVPVGGDNHPCFQIKQACVAGGYLREGHKTRFCFKRLLAHKTVDNVQAPSEEALSACQANLTTYKNGD